MPKTTTTTTTTPHTPEQLKEAAFDVLVEIAQDEDVDPSVRVKAAEAILSFTD